MAFRSNYNGYLEPFLGRIEELHAGGLSSRAIAKTLYDEGARSPWTDSEIFAVPAMAGIVRHILGLQKKKPDISKLKARIRRLKKELRAAERALASAQEG